MRGQAGRFPRSIALGLVMLGSPAIGQDDPDENLVVARLNVEIADANMDRWVYGNAANRSTVLEKLNLLLQVKVEAVDRACHLSTIQKEKLLLAGRGDIKHFLDRVADAQVIFDQLKSDARNTPEILKVTEPVAAQFRTGIFEDRSFVAKVLRTTLQPDQAACYQAMIADRVRFQYQGRVRLAIAGLDTKVGMTGEQRRRLVEVVLEETRPIGDQQTSDILVRIARIPEARLRPLFDDDRWTLVRRQLDKARIQENRPETDEDLEKPDPNQDP